MIATVADPFWGCGRRTRRTQGGGGQIWSPFSSRAVGFVRMGRAGASRERGAVPFFCGCAIGAAGRRGRRRGGRRGSCAAVVRETIEAFEGGVLIRCANTYGSNAPGAASATTESRKRRAAPNAWSAANTAVASVNTRRIKSRGRNDCRRDGESGARGRPVVSAGRTRVATAVGFGARSSKERSSIGRAPVSKTGGWGFDSLRSCLLGAATGLIGWF